MRLPPQRQPIRQDKTLYMPKGYCQGHEYGGPADFQKLIFQNLSGLPFCSVGLQLGQAFSQVF